MNAPAEKAITGAIATAKANSSKIKSVKIKIKMGDEPKKSPGLKNYAGKARMGARAMNWSGPGG